MDKARLYLSELVGTFILVFIGVGSVNDSNTSLLAVSLAFGLAVAVVVAATGHVSGAHINPAVTLALFVSGKIKIVDSIAYIISQLCGATLAAAALKALIPNAVAGDTHLAEHVTVFQGVGLEIVMTFILVLVIYGTAVDMRSQKLPALFIGLTVTVDILVGGPYTGGSLNPARSFGPAMIFHKWDHHWVYWVGPIIGAIAAAAIYTLIFLPRSAAEARPEVRPDAPSSGGTERE